MSASAGVSDGAVRGRFITLEGGEGVGKSTQVRRLAAALRERGIEVVETREPGGSPGAEAIRALLMSGEIDRWAPQTEALLFAAARADHVATTILPALVRGIWVISDRFLDSSIAYQGAADGLGEEPIQILHGIGSGGLLPDRTLMLEMPIAEGAARELARDGGALDRFGARGDRYRMGVAGAFREIVRRNPARCRLIDASGNVDAVTARLIGAVADL